jgi:hypothetical protein
MFRILPIRWLKWFTYDRYLRKHLKCHFLQIELINWLLYILQESIKVSLIAVSVEQLIYLFLTRWCLLSIPPRTLQRHPCPLGRQNYLNKDGCGWGSREPETGIYVKKNGYQFFPKFFFGTLVDEVVLEKNGSRLAVDILENYVSMTIRRSLTPTILNYRCSHSLTNEPCSSTVSR